MLNMARNTFVVPEKFADKSLQQIAQEGGQFGRTDVLANLLGVDPGQKLTSGQQLTFGDLSQSGGAEFQGISGLFGPAQTTGDILSTKQKSEEESFLSALREKMGGQETLTAASERIGGELQLPALRQSAFDLTQTLKNIPQTQQTISKQVGISAPHLQKRIASEQGRLAPVAQEAVGQQQFSEKELGNRLGLLLADQSAELRPFFEAQMPLLQDRLAREQANYSQDKQNELTLLLTNMSQGFQASQADLNRANQLASSENEYQRQIDLIKLGTDEAIRQSGAIKAQNRTGTGGDIFGDINSILQELGVGTQTTQPSQPRQSARILG